MPLGLDKEVLEGEPPFGALEEEVADDIPVMLSEGEYVVPADVVRYWGLKHLEDMRTQAKCGLMYMEMDNRLHVADEGSDEGYIEELEEGEEEEEKEEYPVETPEDIQATRQLMDTGEILDSMSQSMKALGFLEESNDNIEVDFDGKEKLQEPLRMSLGGDLRNSIDEDDRVEDVTTANVDMSGVLGNIGLDPTTGPDVAQKSVEAMAKELVANAMEIGREKQAKEATAASKALGAVGVALSLGAPPGAAGFGNVFGGLELNSRDFGIFNRDGTSFTINMGTGASQLVAKAALERQVEVAINISQNLQPPQDLALFGNSIVSVNRDDFFGQPSAVLTGNVPKSMSVTDFENIQAISVGKDPGTLTRDAKGVPDYTSGTSLSGQDRDAAGNPTSGGYNVNTGAYLDSVGNTSATGPASALSNLSVSELQSLKESRGLGGFFGVDEGLFNQAMKEATQQEFDEEVARTSTPPGTAARTGTGPAARTDTGTAVTAPIEQQVLDIGVDDPTDPDFVSAASITVERGTGIPDVPGTYTRSTPGEDREVAISNTQEREARERKSELQELLDEEEEKQLSFVDTEIGVDLQRLGRDDPVEPIQPDPALSSTVNLSEIAKQTFNPSTLATRATEPVTPLGVTITTDPEKEVDLQRQRRDDPVEPTQPDPALSSSVVNLGNKALEVLTPPTIATRATSPEVKTTEPPPLSLSDPVPTPTPTTLGDPAQQPLSVTPDPDKAEDSVANTTPNLEKAIGMLDQAVVSLSDSPAPLVSFPAPPAPSSNVVTPELPVSLVTDEEEKEIRDREAQIEKEAEQIEKEAEEREDAENEDENEENGPGSARGGLHLRKRGIMRAA